MDPIITGSLISGGASLLGNLLGGSKSGSTTANSAPWSAAQPMLRGLLGGAWDWYQSDNPQEFPFSTLSWFTPEQQMGMNMQAMRSYFGDPYANQAQKLASSTMAGQYLTPNSNPYLRQYYNQAAGDVTNSYLNATLPQLKSTSQAAGMGNSTADALLQGQLMRNLGDSMQKLGTNIYGNAYGNERAIQNNMMNLMPMFTSNTQNDLANLMAVGDQRRQMAQSVLDEVKQAWDTRQAQPYNRLSQYANMILPIAGMGGVQTQSLQNQNPNIAQSFLSSAAAGAGLASAFKPTQSNYQAPSFNYSPVNLQQSMYPSGVQLNAGYGNNYGLLNS